MPSYRYFNDDPIELVTNDQRPDLLFQFRYQVTDQDGTITKQDCDISSAAITPYVWFRRKSADTPYFGRLLTKVDNGTTGQALFTWPPGALTDRDPGNHEFEACLAFSTGGAKTITAATLADPCQLTSVAHGLKTAQDVLITGLGGWSDIDDRVFRITRVDADNFTLNNLDSTAFDAYTGGGTAKRLTDIQTTSNMAWARVREDHR